MFERRSADACRFGAFAVSYTHLDVYKRQIKEWPILDGYCIRRHHGRVLYFKPLRRCAGDHGQPDRCLLYTSFCIVNMKMRLAVLPVIGIDHFNDDVVKPA